MPDLLVATSNRGKLEEIRSYWAKFHPTLKVLTLAAGWTVEETGATFLENAKKKAIETAIHFNRVTLADDSGLLVDALGGEPGVHSARYAGEGAADSARIEKLLVRMKKIPPEKRTARFECTMVLVSPDGSWISETGTVPGVILEQPKGTNGFGFDPVFFIPRLGKTMAEISTSEKNQISHRAQALAKISARIDDFLSKL